MKIKADKILKATQFCDALQIVRLYTVACLVDAVTTANVESFFSSV